MNISGRIYSIKEINENIVSVVLTKKRKKSSYYVSVLFYYQFADLIKNNYLTDDYIKIWFRIRSNKRDYPNGEEKFYTDVIGEKIMLVRREGMTIEKVYSDNGMQLKDVYVCSETGELINKHTLKDALQNQQDRTI